MKILLIVLISFSLFANDNEMFEQYKLSKGDTVTEVLNKKGLTPIYVDENNLNKTLELNRLNLESAKLLKEGDVILLPSTVKSNSSAPEVIYKTIDLNSLMPKKVFKGEMFLTMSTRNERINMGDVKVNANLNNNLGLNLQTELNHFVSVYNMRMSGFLSGFVEKINSPVNISENTKLNTSMNFNITGGLYIEPESIEAKPFLLWQYEEFQGFDVINNSVKNRTNRLSWFGLGIKHTVYFWEHAFSIKPSIAYTIVSESEVASTGVVEGLSGFKSNLEATFDITSKWKVGAQINYYSFRDFDNYNIANYQLSIGRGI